MVQLVFQKKEEKKTETNNWGSKEGPEGPGKGFHGGL
jgi:hypothetical protein